MLLVVLAAPLLSAQSRLVPLRRLSNITQDNNLLTANQAEYDQLLTQGWDDAGIVGYVYPNKIAPGVTPLYRLYNPTTTGIGIGDRVYTASPAERDTYLSKGYTLEGITCYVFPTKNPVICKSLYRTVNTATGRHHYTGGQIEYGGLSYGWQGEGAIAYIYATPYTALPNMSAAQVVQIAAKFCQSINLPVTAAGIAQFPVPQEDGENPIGLLPERLWMARWQVKFGAEATVEVVDGSGMVATFNNDAYFLRTKPQQPVGPLLSQATATQYATAAVVASAQSDTLGSPQGHLTQYNPPHPNVGDCLWQINWDRQLNGINYHSDSVMTVVDAESGEIESFSLTYFTPPPVSTSVTISKAQAQTTAQGQLVSAGIQNATLYSIMTEIVQPNLFWQNGNDDSVPGAGKVAWVYGFTEPTNREGEVWVDAQTGVVIGGFEFGYRGGKTTVVPAHKVLLKKTISKKQNSKVLVGRKARRKHRLSP